MGLYLRKSIRIGPFRFNLSKSGIGVSAGIKGFRAGTGPRGNYVHMGRNGLYFRKTLSSPPQQAHTHNAHAESHEELAYDLNNNIEMHEIESESVEKMVDASSEELIKEINEKQMKARMFPFIFCSFLFLIIIMLVGKISLWIFISVSAIMFPLLIFVYYKDKIRKTTVIFYSLDKEAEESYQELHKMFNIISSSKSIWHIMSEGHIKETKYHAGANTAVKRKSIQMKNGDVPFIKSNISIPFIPVGKQTLAFFPDRLLVIEGHKIGAVNYDSLQLDISQVKFVETEKVPGDALIVDSTWKYVNKKGGPDRRFKDNPEIPVALYEQIHFTSPSGLNEMIKISKIGLGKNFATAISNLSKEVINPTTS